MSTKDRLLEFEAKRDQFEVEITREKKGRKFMREEEKSRSMSWFKEEIDEMKKKLALVGADVSNLKKMHIRMDRLINIPDLQTKEIEMKNLVEQIISKLSNFRREIQLLSSAFSESNTQRNLSDTEQRIISLQIDNLFVKLGETMVDFKTSQANYVDKKKAREVEQRRIIDYPNHYENIGMGPQTATSILQFSEEQNLNSKLDQLSGNREIELQDIERETCEINKLFREMQEHVNDSVSLVDNIEQYVTHAVEKVKKGEKVTMKAKKSKCSGRKKKRNCIIVVIIIVILTFIILLIILH